MKNKKVEKFDGHSIYERLIAVLLDFKPVEDLTDIVHPDFMGYGSAAHEIFRTREDVKKMAEMQAEQLKEQGLKYTRTSRRERLFANGAIYLILEEFHLYFPENDHELLVRVSTLLEKVEGKWQVTHFHGSSPDSDIAEDEAFPDQGLRKKNEELEAKIRERTRELEVETALERVRARTMAMQHSDELAEASHLLDEQVRVLGIKTWGCAFSIYREKDSIEWFGNEAGLLPTYTVPREGIFKEYYEAGQKGETLVVKEFSGEQCVAHYEFMSTLPVVGEVLRQLKETNGSFPEYQIDHVAYFKYGYLLFVTRESVPEAHDIFRRFAGVFEQTYTRFLDLKKAEEQAREAQIELSLERIRAQVTAMQESSELLDIVVTMRSEFFKLGHEAHYFWHMRWLPEHYEKAMTSGDGTRIGMVMKLPRHMHGDIKLLANWEKSQTATVVYAMDAEEAVAYVDKMVSLGDFQQIDPQAPSADDIRHIGGLTFVMARTTHGEIGFSLPGVVPNPPEESIETLVRFAAVFDLAYRRFEDLKESERQKREAEIELALERVRAQTMAMHQSEELEGVIKLIFEQFVSLGLNVDHTGFILDYKTRDDMHIWLADQNAIVPEITFPYFDSPHWNSFLKARKSGESLFTNLLSFEEKNQFYKDLFEHLPEIPKEVRAHYYKVPGLAISTVLLDTVGLYIENFKAAPYSEHENEILMRFGKVFQQSYTRFLDLKKAEAQAREAQIETALERVRSRTMAMHKSEELAEVATVLHIELTNLEVSEFSDASIVIFDEPNNQQIVWGARTESEYLEKSILPLLGDQILQELYDNWHSGETFFTVKVGGSRLKNHNEFVYPVFQRTELEDRVLKNMPDPTFFHCAVFAMGYLELMSDREIREESALLLRRFANVFDQTYTRFQDLKKAESQAREARIEAALERVRARTMAMHHSDELSEVVALLYKQIQILGFNDWGCSIIICNEEARVMRYWYAEVNLSNLPFYCDVPLTHKIVKKTWDLWRSGTSQFEISLLGKEKEDYTNFMLNDTAYNHILPEDVKEEWRKPKDIFFSYFTFKYGLLEIVDVKAIDSGNYPTYRRFVQIIEQTYTRFLDLKKAEAQAREAQIETALEKVRTRTMAMQKGEELKEVAVLLYKELIALGVTNFVTCGYVEVNEEAKRQFTWVTSPGGDTMDLFYLPLNGDATFDERYAAWKRQQTIFHQTVAGEVRNSHLEFAITTFNSKAAEEMVRSQFPDPTVFYCFNFSHGYLHLVCPSVLTEQEEVLLARFTRVFEQTYARFLDLKKAEAQAREAQIENALEKVRSRTMAMQHSDELPEAANVLFLEVQALGIAAWSCGYNILAEDKKSATCIMSSEGTLQTPFKLRLQGERSFDQFGEFARSDEDFMIQELEGEALVAHYNFMKSFPDLQPTFEEIERLGLDLPTYQINHLSKFTHGFLLFITYEPVPEAHDIFKRFTAVFEQTYTRFMDLKNIEAQARESKIETALERVRARALAMQEPEELTNVAEVLRSEMGLLGVAELETSSIFIYDTESNKAECWYAIKDIRTDQNKLVSDQFGLDLKATRVGRQMLEFYTSEEEKTSIAMKGPDRKEWIAYCEKQSKPLKGYYGAEIPDRTYHLYKFSHGAIGAASPAALSEENWRLLQRTASVFSLAYSRFKDLTQARKDLQQLKMAKQKAEEAFSNLQATQQQLVHAEKMASLGELTAGIAHEIQNPLNFVNNFSEVSEELLEELLEELEKGDLEESKALLQDIVQNLQKISHHGKRADGIVKGMLQHSRSGNSAKEPTNLNALADEYLRLAYHGLRAKDKSFNATLETDFDPAVKKVNLVPQDIGRVLLNLYTNAFHAVDERKQKEKKDYTPTVSVKTQKTKEGVEITVSDNGDGIPDNIREKIFQPFFTTKPTGEGTGLGLSMSYDIVTKGHGGTLEVESKAGKGSCFTIILPIKNQLAT
ncbi:ATP-binding protein [Robiginitalea sp. IMCC43444]|uniref:ATP-binding protein n=1 Tax=Robiginitalea sp. IMCC43444 TaxID=3459121 RepID=UPI0040417F75